jgi:hypothetical protein
VEKITLNCIVILHISLISWSCIADRIHYCTLCNHTTHITIVKCVIKIVHNIQKRCHYNEYSLHSDEDSFIIPYVGNLSRFPIWHS